MARILLIDDDELVLETIRGALSRGNHEVVTASDGAEGVRALETGHFDLVITDIIMPNQEGIETIIEIRRRHPDTPIIAMSGGGRTSNVQFLEVAEKLGARYSLEKPFSLARLNALVEACLNEA